MSAEDWGTLASSMPGLCSAVENKDLTHTVALTAKRRVTVSDFIKGTISVDIREYYGQDNDPKPSPKGVLLREPVFKVCFPIPLGAWLQ